MSHFRRLLSSARARIRRANVAPQPTTDWGSLLAGNTEMWSRARLTARGGPTVLLATSVGGHEGVIPIEALLGVALTLRGADVHFLLCDQFLPACMLPTLDSAENHREFVRHGSSRMLCRTCFPAGLMELEPLGLTIHRYSDLVTEAQKSKAAANARALSPAEIPSFRLHGLAVGEHAYAGALRYFARGDLGGEPEGEVVLRRYFQAALLTVHATQNLLARQRFDVACFHHGIYVPQGLIGEVARSRSLRIVNWNPAYRKHCFIFSHGDTYHHTLMHEPTSVWENIDWSPRLEEDVMDYLRSRWYGTRDWVWFHENPQDDLAQISAEVGLDLSKPTIGLLTNVMWDAQLHYPANAFPNMLAWILQTIDYFAQRPDLQLVIRVHPAEIRGTVPSRQKIADEIARVYPQLPPNVFVIPPESNVSTYAVMLQCDSVIIYGTKTGVELSSFGIPVVVAGEAWIRNKGVTMDAEDATSYFRLLDHLPLGRKMDEATTQRARKYAYHFFFRRMIPLTMMQPQTGWPPYRVDFSGLQALMPGNDPGLDVICRGILDGAPFIYPAEILAHPDA